MRPGHKINDLMLLELGILVWAGVEFGILSGRIRDHNLCALARLQWKLSIGLSISEQKRKERS